MKPYRIAFLGNDRKLTICGFFQFIHNNAEQVLRIDRIRNIVQLRDGTIIQAVTNTDPSHLRGSRIDQLILFGDNPWEVYWHRRESIAIIKERMHASSVPEEFQIMGYKNIPIGRNG